MKPRQPNGSAGKVSIPAEDRFWEMREISALFANLFSYPKRFFLQIGAQYAHKNTGPAAGQRDPAK
jgi:hypothetical protein